MKRDQLRSLRARAHKLPPGITVGEAGVSEGLLAEVEALLAQHELLKVRFASRDRGERKAQREALLEASGATQILAIGKICTIWREVEEPDEPAPTA